MGKNGPQRKAGWMCDSEATSHYDQLSAVNQSDRWSERPTIKQEGGDKDYAGTEQRGRKKTNLSARNHFVRNRRRKVKTEEGISKFKKRLQSCPMPCNI